MKRTIYLALLVAAAASQLGTTDCGQVTRDEGFDLWCGSELCVWKVVRGNVRRVPTWHDADSGVELLGADSAISQLTPVDSHDGQCIRFDLVANVSETAEVTLGVDVEGDGTIDHTERIPTSSWKPISFRLLVSAPFDGIRFELAKRGDGTAVLARIDAELADDCTGLTPIPPSPRPLGAACDATTGCTLGSCTPFVLEPPPGTTLDGTSCNACTAGSCTTGQTCGYTEPLSPVLEGFAQCVPLGAHVLAEHCIANDECASGICDHNTCSACVTDTACARGTCGPAWVSGFFGLFPGPAVCAPSEGRGASGEACGTDFDCASQHCDGAPRKQCDDGRTCETALNCPVDSTLAPGECKTIGVQGGRCR